MLLKLGQGNNYGFMLVGVFTQQRHHIGTKLTSRIPLTDSYTTEGICCNHNICIVPQQHLGVFENRLPVKGSDLSRGGVSWQEATGAETWTMPDFDVNLGLCHVLLLSQSPARATATAEHGIHFPETRWSSSEWKHVPSLSETFLQTTPNNVSILCYFGNSIWTGGLHLLLWLTVMLMRLKLFKANYFWQNSN